MGFLSKFQRRSEIYAYHTTSPENSESIRNHGVLRSESDSHDTATIRSVLNELDYEDPLPFDRSNVTYCDLDASYIEDTLRELREAGFATDDVVVVAVNEIDAPMYLADMSLISDLIDYKHGGSKIMMHADSPEETIQLYKESIVKVKCAEDTVSDLGVDHGHTELVVDGNIPPSAIVDICSCTTESETDS